MIARGEIVRIKTGKIDAGNIFMVYLNSNPRCPMIVYVHAHDWVYPNTVAVIEANVAGSLIC